MKSFRTRFFSGCWSVTEISILVILCVGSGFIMTEGAPYGMKKLDFPHYFTISWFCMCTYLILFPCLLMYECFRRVFRCCKKRNKSTSSINARETYSLNVSMSELIKHKEIGTSDMTEDEEEDEYVRLPHGQLYARSAIFVVMGIFCDYFCYLSLYSIPPSINMIIFSSGCCVTLMFSVIMLWKTVRTNIIPKTILCLTALGGIVMIALGSRDSSNSLSSYPNFIPGVIYACISITGISFNDVLYLMVYGDISFINLLYLSFYCGLNSLIVFWVVLPLLAVTGIEPITWEIVSNPYIWLFMIILGLLFVFYVTVTSLLLQRMKNPVLVVVVCMVLEIASTLTYDHIVLGVRYSYWVWVGSLVIIASATVMNCMEILPFDMGCLVMKVSFRCCCGNGKDKKTEKSGEKDEILEKKNVEERGG